MGKLTRNMAIFNGQVKFAEGKPAIVGMVFTWWFLPPIETW